MKNNVKRLGRGIMFIMIVLSYANQLSGQDKVSISAGVGFLETMNVGVKYQINQSQIGLSIGTWFPSSNSYLYWKSLVSISGDYYYHFGGKSQYSDLHPWYARIGVDYLRVGKESSVENDMDAHIRLGRDCYFSKNAGISLDLGFGSYLKNESGYNKLLPSLGMCLFFKF